RDKTEEPRILTRRCSDGAALPERAAIAGSALFVGGGFGNVGPRPGRPGLGGDQPGRPLQRRLDRRGWRIAPRDRPAVHRADLPYYLEAKRPLVLKGPGEARPWWKHELNLPAGLTFKSPLLWMLG